MVRFKPGTATSGLCRPSLIRCVSWLVMIGSSGSLTWAFQLGRPANYRLLDNHDNNCSDLTSAFPRLLTTPTTKTFGFKLPQFLFFLFLLKKSLQNCRFLNTANLTEKLIRLASSLICISARFPIIIQRQTTESHPCVGAKIQGIQYLVWGLTS